MALPEQYTRKQLEAALQKALLDLVTSRKMPLDREIFPEPAAGLAGQDQAEPLPPVEAQLQLQLDFLSAVFSASGEGICAIDIDGKITFANPTVKRVLGYTNRELLGKDFHETIHYRHLDGTPYPRSECPLVRVLQTGVAVHNREEWLFRKDSTAVEVACTAIPILHGEKAIGYIMTFHDITERRAEEQVIANMLEATKKANAQLKKSIERQQKIAEFSRQALEGMDINALLNQALALLSQSLEIRFCKIIEQLHDPKNGLRVRAVCGFDPDFSQQVDSLASESLAEYTLQVEMPVVMSNIHKETRFQPSPHYLAKGLTSALATVIYGEGKPFGILEVAMDCEYCFEEDEVQFVQSLANILGIAIERRQAERALSESERRYAAMVEEAAVGIGRISPVGHWQDANRKFCEILGYSLEELKTMTCHQVTYPEDIDVDLAMFQALLAEGATHCTLEKRYVRKNGSLVWVNLTSSPVRNEEGRVIYIIGLVEDITSRKEAEAELVKSRLALEDSNRELEQFAAIASHDLKAPLRKIELFSGYLGQAEGDCLSPESLDYLERIRGSVQSMGALIEDLLFLAKASRETMHLEEVDLTQVAQEVISNLSAQIGEKSAQVQLETLCRVEGDPTQLGQLFQNLVQNGLKFQREMGQPRIGILMGEPDPGFCEIRVRDNGIGMREDQTEQIFKPFERLHGKQEFSGTGIGLSICYRIVERHHGSIRVESKPGEGSTFIVRLPFRQPPA